MSDATGKWDLGKMPSQEGKRFLVTGANSGIGYWAAVGLAKRGAEVVLACRDVARGRAAVERMKVDAAGPESAVGAAEVVELDLASLDSVKRVAEAEVARHQPLHGLINNAGVMAPKKRLETKDGFELQFGTNVLGHYALTCRLLPALQMGGGAVPEETARVVTVASIAHKRGRLDFEDLQATKKYDPMGAYSQSKLGDLMFAMELERKLREHAYGVTSIAVHPGVAKTNLFKVGDGKGLAGVAQGLLQFGLGLVFESDKAGALPTLFAATAEEAKGGGYYGPQGFQEMRGGDVGVAKVAEQAKDAWAQERLWDICAELTGVTV